MTYFDNWADDSKQGMADSFAIKLEEIQDCEILFALYSYGDYDGSAFVLFKKDGKLYEVNGGHCSCFGLEGQWEPEETTVAAIRVRQRTAYKGFTEFNTQVLMDALNKLEQEGY